MKCIICNLEKESSKEHIIPEAIGNKVLLTDKVCKDCNSKLGERVDAYWVNHPISKIIRKEAGLRGKKHKEVNILPHTLKDQHGDVYTVRDDMPHRIPKTKLDNGILTVDSASIEESLEIAKKILDKYAELTPENKKHILDNYKVGKPYSIDSEFAIPADIDLGRFILFFIKIAYEYCCEVLGEPYYSDEIAQSLRQELYNCCTMDKSNLQVDFGTVSKYAMISNDNVTGLKNLISDAFNMIQIKTRHAILLHDTVNHVMVCDVFLFMDKLLPVSIRVSDDARKYLGENGVVGSIMLESGEVISI